MSVKEAKQTGFMRHGATLGGVFWVSLSLLLTELLLTRVFSVLFMYHFAFLVISLALFGLGVGGIAVYLYPERFAGNLQRRLVTTSLAFAASIVVLVLFLFNLPLAPSSSMQGALVLIVVYFVSSLPFFVGGTGLSVLLSQAGQDVGRLYFVDLLGAGLGCFLIIPALNYLGGVTSLLCASAGAALAALCFAIPEDPSATSERPGALLRRVLMIIGIGAAAGCVLAFVVEPLALWVGEQIFHAHPVYSKRGHPFSYYFEQHVGPELRRITSASRWPLMFASLLAFGGVAWVGKATADDAGRRALGKKELRLVSAVVLATVIGMVALNAATDAIRIRFAKGRVEFQNLFEGWNSFSRIAVLPRRATHTYAWGLSPLYKGDPGEQLALDIDSLAGTPLVKFNGDINSSGIAHLSWDITAMAYEIRPARSTLIIGPGGGRDVLTALKYGSKDIEAVELNPLMRDVVNVHFGDFTSRLYQRPEIHLTIDDGRHYVRNSQKKYGLLQLSLVDTWASTAAGAFALSENTLYTTEAFQDYIAHLADDGVLTVSRWLDETPRETLRVVSLARDALAQFGVNDISDRILVAGTPPLRRSHRFASVIVSRRPFTPEELAKARKFVEERGFEILYFPDERRNPIFTEAITTKDLDGFLNNYEIDVRPTTDDKPFFFNTVWPRDFFRFWDEKPGRVGVQLLARVLLLVLGLVALFILAPLFLRKRSILAALDSSARWSTLVYFSALGAGFMLIEVGLISKFILFLGHPIYALTVVLCTLLISAGLGSYWSGKSVAADHAALGKVIGSALGAIVLLALVLELVFRRIVGTSFPVSMAMTVCTLAPVGFLMGMPFPLGLRLLDRAGKDWAALIPWVWGINGASSVLGSILAISIAINLGFRMTLVAGLCVYGLAFLASRLLAGGPATLAAPSGGRRKAGGAKS